MGSMASQITRVPIVYSTVCSGADHRKHESSVSLAFVRGIDRLPLNSQYKWPVTWKMFPFEDVIMHTVYVRVVATYIRMYSSDHGIRKHDARRIKINHITTSLWNQRCLIQFCYVFLYPQNPFVLRFSRTGFIVIKRQYIKGISALPMNLDVVSEPPYPWGYYFFAPLSETATSKVEMTVTTTLRKRCTRYVIKDNWSRARMIEVIWKKFIMHQCTRLLAFRIVNRMKNSVW